MGTSTRIEWAHHTFNAWRGCTKVSAGCANCYAETLSKRNPQTLGVWGDSGKRVVAAESYWAMPRKWNAAAKAAGERRRVFALSLGDWLEDRPELVAPLARLLLLIIDTPDLDWLLLTKRPENWERRLREAIRHLAHDLGDVDARVNDLRAWLDGIKAPKNVWIGASVEDPPAAEARIRHLFNIPARVRFLSCEPLLRPLDLSHVVIDPMGSIEYCVGGTVVRSELKPVWLNALTYTIAGQRALHWVIVGGESGSKSRPLSLAAARSVRDQCFEAGVAFFMKQLGSSCEINFDEWNEITSGGIDGSNQYILNEPGGESGVLKLLDKKGADTSEWPVDLLIRQLPKGAER